MTRRQRIARMSDTKANTADSKSGTPADGTYYVLPDMKELESVHAMQLASHEFWTQQNPGWDVVVDWVLLLKDKSKKNDMNMQTVAYTYLGLIRTGDFAQATRMWEHLAFNTEWGGDWSEYVQYGDPRAGGDKYPWALACLAGHFSEAMQLPHIPIARNVINADEVRFVVRALVDRDDAKGLHTLLHTWADRLRVTEGAIHEFTNEPILFTVDNLHRLWVSTLWHNVGRVRSYETLRVMMEWAKWDPEAPDDFGNTLLHIIIEENAGLFDVHKHLLDQDFKDFSLEQVQYAMHMRRMEAVKAVKISFGYTAIVDVCRQLIRNAKNPDNVLRANDKNMNPGELALYYRHEPLLLFFLTETNLRIRLDQADPQGADENDRNAEADEERAFYNHVVQLANERSRGQMLAFTLADDKTAKRRTTGPGPAARSFFGSSTYDPNVMRLIKGYAQTPSVPEEPEDTES